jgi:2'-5' RNA ligase
MAVIRSFIAIDLSSAVQERLVQVLDQLSSKFDRKIVRWVQVEKIHLTLKFLGDVPVSEIQTIHKILDETLIKQPKFSFEVARLGAFPSIRNPRIIWVGVEAPPTLTEIKLELDRQLGESGYSKDKKPFSPHLTLGRVSKNARSNEIKNLSKVIQSSRIGIVGRERVEAVHLFKSVLQPSGAVYSKIATCPLM